MPTHTPADTQFLAIEAAAHAGDFGLNNRALPTESQILAGNYKKGRVNIFGQQIAIEQPLNSYRTGKDANGKEWRSRLAAHYGYFIGTKGNDGDPVDCFIGPWPEAEHAYVINQFVGGKFDEHKIVLNVPDEAFARRVYLDSYERGWNGLESIIRCTKNQLKWWLRYGNMTRRLRPEHLPFEGIETMQKRVYWDQQGNPEGATLDQVLYAIKEHDAEDGLVMDAITIADILEDADSVIAFDALVTPYAQLERKMQILNRVMEREGGTVKPTAMQISEPFKQKGVAQVAVVWELSDGQTVSVLLHNPDVTPAKMAPTDELISYAWRLNKKDITIVVAPERGTDLNPREVARRIMKLAEKNSAAFQRANEGRATRMAEIEGIKTEIVGLEKELASALNELEVAKVEAEERAVNVHYSTAILDALVSGYGWSKSDADKTVEKDVGGAATGGEVNPNGSRIVYGSFDNNGRYLALKSGFDDIFDIDCRGRDVADVAKEFDTRVNEWAASTAVKKPDGYKLKVTVGGVEHELKPSWKAPYFVVQTDQEDPNEKPFFYHAENLESALQIMKLGGGRLFNSELEEIQPPAEEKKAEPAPITPATQYASMLAKLTEAGVVFVESKGAVFLSKDGTYPIQYTNNKQAYAAVEKLQQAGFLAHVTAMHPFKVLIDSEAANASGDAGKPAPAEEDAVTSPTDAELEAAAMAGAEVSRITRNMADPSTAGMVPVAYLKDNKDISIALWTEDDFKRAASAVNEAEGQMAYSKFDAFGIKMPTAVQLGAKKRAANGATMIRLNDSGEGWTNGHLLDTGALPTFIKKVTDAVFGDTPLDTVKADHTARIIDSAKSNNIQVEPVANYNAEHADTSSTAAIKKGAKIQTNAVVLVNKEVGIAVTIDARYFAYFFKTYKGAEFFTSSDDRGSVAVKKAGQVVGVIMPIGSKSADVLKRAMKAITTQAVAPAVVEQTPAAKVDAAYPFASASTAFKEWLSESLDKAEYSPFATAKAMDEAAKRNGASIEWDLFGGAAMDSVSMDAVEDDKRKKLVKSFVESWHRFQRVAKQVIGFSGDSDNDPEYSELKDRWKDAEEDLQSKAQLAYGSKFAPKDVRGRLEKLVYMTKPTFDPMVESHKFKADAIKSNKEWDSFVKSLGSASLDSADTTYEAEYTEDEADESAVSEDQGVLFDAVMMGSSAINVFGEGDKVVCMDSDEDLTVAYQKSEKVFVIDGKKSYYHANRLRLASGKKPIRIMLDSAAGSWIDAGSEEIAATKSLLKYYRDFLKSDAKFAKVPVMSWTDAGQIMDKNDALQRLKSMIDVAINRKAGIPDMTAKEDQRLADFAHDARIISDYLTKRVRHTGSRNMLRTPEMKSKYPDIDNQPRYDSAFLDGVDQDGYVGRIFKDGTLVGRIDIGEDGKAMVFVGGAGDVRVKFKSGVVAGYSDDDAAEMVESLLTVAQDSTVDKPEEATAMNEETTAQTVNGRKEFVDAMTFLTPFMSRSQLGAMKQGAAGEEAQYFYDKAVELANTIKNMPATYGQDGKGDESVAYLHYFRGGADWYITEKDIDGGVQQAFGLADLGQGAELGYISIEELARNGVELDFHWAPKTIGAIKEKDAVEEKKGAELAAENDRLYEESKRAFEAGHAAFIAGEPGQASQSAAFQEIAKNYPAVGNGTRLRELGQAFRNGYEAAQRESAENARIEAERKPVETVNGFPVADPSVEATADNLPVSRVLTDGDVTIFKVYIRRLGREVRVHQFRNKKFKAFREITETTEEEEANAIASILLFNRDDALKQIDWFKERGFDIPDQLYVDAGLQIPASDAPVEDPKAADIALFQSVANGTHPDMIEASLADKMEEAYMRNQGDQEIEALFIAAVNAYQEAALKASANI